MRNRNVRGFGVGVTAGQFGRSEQLNIAHIRSTGISSADNQRIGNVVRIVAGDGIAGYGDFRTTMSSWCVQTASTAATVR